jgi:hypothetical protein
VEYVPSGQATHDNDFSADVFPAGHGRQVLDVVAPTVAEYVFAVHGVQPIEPAVAYVPGRHLLGGLFVQSYPAGQDAEQLVARSAEYCPAGQVVHDFIPPVHLVPGGQGLAVPSDSTYLPSSVDVHAPAPAGEN